MLRIPNEYHIIIQYIHFVFVTIKLKSKTYPYSILNIMQAQQLSYLISLYDNDNITLDHTIKEIMRGDRYVIASNIEHCDPDVVTSLMKFGFNVKIDCDTCCPMFISLFISEYPINRWSIIKLTNQDKLRELIVLLDDCKLKYVSEYAREVDIAEYILSRDRKAKCIQYQEYKHGMDTDDLDKYIPESLVSYYIATLDERAKDIIIGNNIQLVFELSSMRDVELDICLSGLFNVKVITYSHNIYVYEHVVNILLRNNIRIECLNEAKTYQQLVYYIDFDIKPSKDIKLGDSKPNYKMFLTRYYKALDLYPDVKKLGDAYPELLIEDKFELITM